MSYTLVIGASENPERYSNKAIKALQKNGQKVIALAPKSGEVDGIHFYTDINEIASKYLGLIDTITLYLNPTRQSAFEDAIIGLKPKRVIFNPGTENPSFYSRLKQNDIIVQEACTLVLLATHQY